ncbi:type II toxin-antitoxin system RelB/DinJ family antitoxin [Streptococcus anginosus]|uniref:type II toxin-antitoxin system RelB/DinJ family antitoxin n=1 Tax=Streptococcus anginosus TaxID=1328 RepID=UPI001247FC77|nr:type II toxin-antitoxin system RelB/DinJ family antitoxin [Streptococcus anginosus]KAA9268306.1 type II toxin-antitoxin system RelB/DinJ family antitoxin [Streptococcus anginosus]MCW0928400.1 type II toxin-antitoxin system RelB/DinJ family antitoxin [Streptococcus anginosus]MED5863299.1 type II toxin-antitoxin system RelB/DinJ family antitoxin [Streptococcus anginosus]
MSTTNLNIRTDKEIKEAAEKIYSSLGLNMTTAINMFLRASIRESGIPFDLKLDIPNDETIKAIEEGRMIAKDNKVKSYDNIDDLRKALGV